MATFDNIALEEASTVTHRLAAVVINRGGTNEDQEILVLGDPESSIGLARVLGAAPDSTHLGVVVRQVGNNTLPSTQKVELNSTQKVELNSTQKSEAIPITSSGLELTTNTDPASTAEGIIVRDVRFTTTVQVSSVGGLVKLPSTQKVELNSTQKAEVIPITSSGLELTTNTTPGSTAEGIIVRTAGTALLESTQKVELNSTQKVELNSTQKVELNSTQSVVLRTSTGGFLTTNTDPGSTADAVVVRQVGFSTTAQVSSVGGIVALASTQKVEIANPLSTGIPANNDTGVLSRAIPTDSTFVTGFASSARSTVVAAVSTSKLCVFSVALSVVKPSSQHVQLFGQGSTTAWSMVFHSTAASVGAVETVDPPHYLFRTDTGQGLVLFSSGGTANVRYSIGYYEG